MGWRFRRTITRGRVRHTITHKGVGTSIAFFWFRLGMTPSGIWYATLTIPGTGLSYIRYFGTLPGAKPRRRSPGREPAQGRDNPRGRRSRSREN